jgi:hypothetical protein
VRGHQDSFTGRYAHANGCRRQPPIGSFDSLGVGRVLRIQVVQVADAQRSSDAITTCSRGQPRGGQVRSLLRRTPKRWSQTARSDYPRGLAVHHSNEHSTRDLRLTGLVPLGSSSLRGSTSARPPSKLVSGSNGSDCRPGSSRSSLATSIVMVCLSQGVAAGQWSLPQLSHVDPVIVTPLLGNERSMIAAAIDSRSLRRECRLHESAASTNDQARRALSRRRSDFRIGPADSESGSAAIRPVSADVAALSIWAVGPLLTTLIEAEATLPLLAQTRRLTACLATGPVSIRPAL